MNICISFPIIIMMYHYQVVIVDEDNHKWDLLHIEEQKYYTIVYVAHHHLLFFFFFIFFLPPFVAFPLTNLIVVLQTLSTQKLLLRDTYKRKLHKDNEMSADGKSVEYSKVAPVFEGIPVVSNNGAAVQDEVAIIGNDAGVVKIKTNPGEHLIVKAVLWFSCLMGQS